MFLLISIFSSYILSLIETSETSLTMPNVLGSGVSNLNAFNNVMTSSGTMWMYNNNANSNPYNNNFYPRDNVIKNRVSSNGMIADPPSLTSSKPSDSSSGKQFNNEGDDQISLSKEI